VPAAIGALLLALIWGFAFRDFPRMEGLAFTDPGGRSCSSSRTRRSWPWAPLLAAVTYAYYRRRCRD
jgi:hypothetical protein